MGQKTDVEIPQISVDNCGGDLKCSIFAICHKTSTFQCRNCGTMFNSKGDRVEIKTSNRDAPLVKKSEIEERSRELTVNPATARPPKPLQKA